jgi:hypothetical protein
MNKLPKVGSRCSCDGCEGRIIDRNPLTQTVKVALDNDGGVVTVPVAELTL